MVFKRELMIPIILALSKFRDLNFEYWNTLMPGRIWSECLKLIVENWRTWKGKLERMKIQSLMKKWWMKRIFDKV